MKRLHLKILDDYYKVHYIQVLDTMTVAFVDAEEVLERIGLALIRNEEGLAGFPIFKETDKIVK